MQKRLAVPTFIITGLFIVPLLLVFVSVFSVQTEIWQHLFSTVLNEYVLNSLLLALGTGFGVITLGTYLAWCMVHYDFWGKSILNWLVLLPLAMPAYIIAYTYTGLFDFASPLQAFIRTTLNTATDARVLPDIRNLTGAIVMMTLVLYPYVYLLARNAFKEQSPQFEKVGQLAQVSPLSMFWRVYLPLARPAIFTGAALAMMESLADYGTVAYFGVSTFTTGIYRTWFGLGNLQAASQLATMLCMFVFIVLVLEKHSRKHASRYQVRHNTLKKPSKLPPRLSVIMFLVCLIPPLFGFVIPFYQLMHWSIAFFEWSRFEEYLPTLFASLKLAFISTLVIVACALVITYTKRLLKFKVFNHVSSLLSLGYALPGVVIAVGVVQVGGFFDVQFNHVTVALFDWQPGLILSGSLWILVFAYAIRYLSVALHNTETGLERIKPNLDEVAMTLRPSIFDMLKKVHMPLMKSSIISAAILVFVDVLKELPATLILRPFNFNTLAVKAYELASDERLIDAALPAVSIVFAGIIPVVLLTRTLEKQKA